MPTFSAKSNERLNTCDERLQRLFREVVKEWDCTVLCGHRSQEEQDLAFKEGRSKTKWPNGKHNSLPSRAADVVPYPINWEDKLRINAFAKFVMVKAKEMNIKIRWGGDWNQNGRSDDERFYDSPHFELLN